MRRRVGIFITLTRILLPTLWYTVISEENIRTFLRGSVITNTYSSTPLRCGHWFRGEAEHQYIDRRDGPLEEISQGYMACQDLERKRTDENEEGWYGSGPGLRRETRAMEMSEDTIYYGTSLQNKSSIFWVRQNLLCMLVNRWLKA